jgi:hypothetical protein
MKSRTRLSLYKGSAVAVRWTELDASSLGRRLYVGSYSITGLDGVQGPWRHFKTKLFHTLDTAAGFALGEAKLSIDNAQS